jgi:hypothetical protein
LPVTDGIATQSTTFWNTLAMRRAV